MALFKINNGSPAGHRHIRWNWLVQVDPAQGFRWQRSTRPGWVRKSQKIALRCVCLDSDSTWLEGSSGAHRTHHNAVPAVSLSEAARPFGYK